MILDTRPSRFSACNIESWEGPGDEASRKSMMICTSNLSIHSVPRINVSICDLAVYSLKHDTQFQGVLLVFKNTGFSVIGTFSVRFRCGEEKMEVCMISLKGYAYSTKDCRLAVSDYLSSMNEG